GSRPLYLHERGSGSGRLLAARALTQIGRRALNVELRPWSQADRAATAQAALRLLTREARLTGAGMVIGPIEHLLETPGLVDELPSDLPVVLIGSESWDPQWSRRLPLRLDVPEVTLSERAALWRNELGD